ncbi:MAG TPA: hypothetical protein VFQ65_02605 [Kofleriaceae bacterium]|nr:hypothetical protein [Kofleriaceae bacterium]
MVVNASGDNPGQVERIHRVLDQRGMLFHVNESLEATLEGRSLLTPDLELIRHAYASADFTTALKIIEEDEMRLMLRGGADLTTSLSTLAGWRGLIAAADDKDDESLRQFRAAVRMNPAYQIDKKLPSPKVRAIILKAHHEVDATGVLKTTVDPEDARVAVDGNDSKQGGEKVRLPVGLHLVQISAQQRKSHAEIVDIDDVKPVRIDVLLDPESLIDKAVKLVDESAAAPSGAARLDRAKALSKLVGVNRMLFVEGASEAGVKVRLYDVTLKKISKSMTLDGNASSAAIASQIKSALDPDTVDVNTVVVGHDGEPGHDDERWYNHWYIWAGAAVVVGGALLTYSYESRDPTSIKGF